MPRRPRLELNEPKRQLAAMIDTALNSGQSPDAKTELKPWTNLSFAAATASTESSVRAWRDTKNPTMPVNIIPLVNAFYGTDATTSFPEPRAAMKLAWQRAKGHLIDDPPAPGPRAIRQSNFAGPIKLVDLTVSQPTPDNAANLIVPYTLHIYPDTDCRYHDQSVEIGVTAAVVKVDAQQWQPNADSLFRKKTHPNVHGNALKGAVDVMGPVDSLGRLAGAPFPDEPAVTMEPAPDPTRADDPTDDIEFQVQVSRNWFHVTIPGAGSAPSINTKAVLDAIFAEAFPRTDHNQHILTSATVAGKTRRDTGE
ncbi:MAG: hypothetical protein EXR07_05660 [Acetobacteraceae bacterium]|nr:hypothetical protein [Acetobacteraceae bacterium]